MVFRLERGRLLGVLLRRTDGDFELAEEALQDAFAAALEQWPRDGAPDQPAAWLTTVAQRRLLDRQRREQLRSAKQRELEEADEATRARAEAQANAAAARSEALDEFPCEDERLRLLFTCSHPALAHPAQVALTLNAVCGLQAPELARAFVVPEATIAQRLVRAKKKIRAASIPVRIPPPSLLPDRVASVLRVLYLVFNEGYTAARGALLVRADLCEEAIALARSVCDLLPDHAEARGLLALFMVQDARRDARVGDGGELVLLEDQDRSLFDQSGIDAGVAELERAAALRRPGPYQLQATIAALHARAPSFAETDWPAIVTLYDRMLLIQDTPVVRLNRAVAVAMADGPEAGLGELAELSEDGQLGAYPYYWSTRADLRRRVGELAAARADYERALSLTANETERRFLQRRLDELE